MIDIKSVYKIVLISLIFGVVGFFVHPYFVKLSIMEMKDVNVVTIDKEAASNLKILMAIIFTFIPLFFFSAIKVLTIENQRDKIFILLSIIIAGIIFWQFKLYSIQERLLELRAQTKGKIINFVFAQEDLNLEFYLLIGFFVGVIISGIALIQFRKRKI
jgi:hypothetical protein